MIGSVDKKIKRISEKGITLLEGLVSTAIIGIGFVAVFQMVQYSVRSIDVSGERTKATYIVGTIAEDIYAFKNQEKGTDKFVDLLKDNQWKSDKCQTGKLHPITNLTLTIIKYRNGMLEYQQIISNV